MSARIFCKVGELAGLSAEIGEAAILGRSRQATIPILAELVSGEHARIRFEPEAGCYVLEDLGSTNGTELDGMKVRGVERLGHLHVITIAGAYDLIFQDLSATARRHGGVVEPKWREDTQVDENPPVLPPVIAGSGEVSEGTVVEPLPVGLPGVLALKADKPRSPTPKTLVFALEISGEEGTERFRLEEGVNLLGRGEDASVKLDIMDISRRHASLTVAGGKVTVRDMGSSNHTYLEGVEIEGAAHVPLGAELRFGGLRARLTLWDEEEDR